LNSHLGSVLELSADGEMRQRLAERVDDAYLTLRMKKSKGKTADWASASVQLAEALTALAGEEEDREAFERYEQAIHAYNQALEIFKPEEDLSAWGEAVVSFARALRSYAAREGGHMSLMRLDHAARLLGGVIEAMLEKKGLFDCAMLHIELAHVYRAKATIDREETRLDHLYATLKHFEEAARILRMKENFDNWAIAVIGQAITWRDIAPFHRQDPLPALNRAADLLKTVLSYYTPQNQPMDWVFSTYEYGKIWLRIAYLSQGKAVLEAAAQAISSLRLVIDHVVAENAPDLWVRSRTDLAQILTLLASSVSEKEEAIKAVEEAIALYRILIRWYDDLGDPIGVAMTHASLGKELGKLASLVESRKSFSIRMQAAAALRRSVPSLLEQELPDEWLTNMFELAAALNGLTHHYELSDSDDVREELVTICRHTIKHMNIEMNPVAGAMIRSWLGSTLASLGEQDDTELGLARLLEAELCFRQALSLRAEQEDAGNFVWLENNLGHLFYILARRLPDPQAKDYCEQALRSISRAKDSSDVERNPVEWCNVQSNYAMVLLHRIRRNFSPDILEDCQQSSQAFLNCLDIFEEHMGLIPQLFLQRNLALLFSLWAQQVDPREAYPLYLKAHELLIDIRERIKTHKLENMDDMVEESDMEDLEAVLENCRPRKPLERLLAWLF